VHTVSACTSYVTDDHGMPQCNSNPGYATPVAVNYDGSAHISTTNPGVTAGNGQVQFDVTDQVQETAVYTAIDVSDGNLPVPGSANVTFSGAVANSCGNGSTPVGAEPLGGRGRADRRRRDQAGRR